MNKSKNKDKSKEIEFNEDEDLDRFIEKRKIQNEALKKIIGMNDTLKKKSIIKK